MANLPDQSENRRPPVKLLILDDNERMRDMVGFYLQDLADEIRVCGNGAEALRECADFLPDWVLLEVYLHETDGFALINRINEVCRRAKIVVLTNHTDAQTRQAASSAGAFAFFGKDDLLALAAFIKTETRLPAK